jgi:NADPH:quinone reductase-like Zn-dependent oxidoreductase
VTAPSNSPWFNKRVILNPGTGWKDNADGPEAPTGYAIMGGTKFNPAGTLADVVTLSSAELEACPEHLSDAEAASLPLTGLTAWRAFFTKSGNAIKGRNILVTGIGGGVALMVLLYGVAQGCNVYVTSGNQEKIDKAVKLGAKGGVLYKEEGWEKKLKAALPKDRPYLDAIVDGAGGDIVAKGTRLLKVRSLTCFYARMVLIHVVGWRDYFHLRHDHIAQNALLHARRPQQHRSPRLHHGLAQGIRRHGAIRAREENQANCQPKCAWARRRKDRWIVRRHEEC